METVKVDAATLAGGAIIERLNDALMDVIANIQDINTSDKATREVSLKIKIKPSSDRQTCSYEIHCQPKLAPPSEIANIVYVGIEGGEAVMYENDPRQADLFENDNIVPMKEVSND